MNNTNPKPFCYSEFVSFQTRAFFKKATVYQTILFKQLLLEHKALKALVRIQNTPYVFTDIYPGLKLKLQGEKILEMLFKTYLANDQIQTLIRIKSELNLMKLKLCPNRKASWKEVEKLLHRKKK